MTLTLLSAIPPLVAGGCSEGASRLRLALLLLVGVQGLGIMENRTETTIVCCDYEHANY